MTDYQQLVKEFHDAFSCHIAKKTGLADKKERNLRVNLLIEEFGEYLVAENQNDIVEISDALGDMLYIIFGTAVSYGIPMNKIFEEIHKSNMSKLDDNGKAIYNEFGKVVKGPNFFKPRIKEILGEKD